MKIQLDYDRSVITLENNVNLGEFFNKIKSLLPDWKKWNLDTQTTIEWDNPITVPWYPGPYYPSYPYYPRPWYEHPNTITFDITGSHQVFAGDNIPIDSSGIYCLDV